MYWSRSGSFFELFLWIVLSGIWGTGGWLLSIHLFRMPWRERLFSGMSVGFLLFILLSNLFALLLPLTVAYWSAAILILGVGLLISWRSPRRPKIPFHDYLNWRQGLAFLGFLTFFMMLNRGLAIFDDNNNLPLTSIIATDDVPPHYYLNADQRLDYHYGLHLFSASLVRVGGFFPWSALDFGKALSQTFTVLLAWLWLRRFMPAHTASLWGIPMVLFSSGTRWLLLLMPQNLLSDLSTRVHLIGSAALSGADLLSALGNPWNIEGDGLFPFPFAFVNGIHPPLTLSIAGSAALPQMTLFLLLLLAQKEWRPLQGLIYGLVLSSLALTAEHFFLIAWLGIILAILVGMKFKPSTQRIKQWSWVLLPGLILPPFMGGVLTEVTRRLYLHLRGDVIPEGMGFGSVSLRWPPAVLSAHLGSLPLHDARLILVALAEIGPLLLLSIPVTWHTWKRIQNGKWALAGIGIGAMAGFVFPLVVSLSIRDRDISRMMGLALTIWVALGLPYTYLVFRRSKKVGRFLIGACCALILLGGIALFPYQLIATARPQLSYFVQDSDAVVSKAYWDRLEKGAWVLDLTDPSRASTLFGRSVGHAWLNATTISPDYLSLLANPDVKRLAEAGYSYIYMGQKDWRDLTAEIKKSYQQACVKDLTKAVKGMSEKRYLFDIRACKK